MDSFYQLQTDVFYLAGRKRDFAAAMARVDAFAAEACGVDTGRALWLRGALLREEGHPHEAMQTFSEAESMLAEDPKMLAACLLDSAALANRLGDLRAAEAIGKRFLEMAERNPEAQSFSPVMFGNIGETHYLRGNLVGAIEWHKRAIRLLEDPYGSNLPRATRLCMMAYHWHGLARCYLGLGDLVRVRFAIDGIRQCPHPDLQGIAAFDEFQINLRLGNLPHAERWLDEADHLIRDRMNRQLVLLGRILLAQARSDLASAEDYQKMLYAEHDMVFYEVEMQLNHQAAKEEVQS